MIHSKPFETSVTLIFFSYLEKNRHSFKMIVPNSYRDDKDRLRDDKEVVMEAVSNGYELFNVSERLKSDKDVVLLLKRYIC